MALNYALSAAFGNQGGYNNIGNLMYYVGFDYQVDPPYANPAGIGYEPPVLQIDH